MLGSIYKTCHTTHGAANEIKSLVIVKHLVFQNTWLFLVKARVVIAGTKSAYSADKETEIRNETVLHYSYDPVSRPDSQTRVKVGLNILAIDELVRSLFYTTTIKISRFTPLPFEI